MNTGKIMYSCLQDADKELRAGCVLKNRSGSSKYYNTLYNYGRIVRCWLSCYGGNKEAFLEDNPKFNMKFTCGKKKPVKHTWPFPKAQDK